MPKLLEINNLSFVLEIKKVQNLLCSATDRKPLDLPEPKGPTVTLTEKIFVPVDKYPNVNSLLLCSLVEPPCEIFENLKGIP